MNLELREEDAGTLRLEGWASLTEHPYEMHGYTEVIKRHAFRRTLAEDPDVQLLINHEGIPLARTRSAVGPPTLRLAEDEIGLRVSASLDAGDPDVQRLARAMRKGLVDQMSFSFQATQQTWNDTYTRREIQAVSLHRGDVSMVNQGASPDTSASIREYQGLGLEERRRRAEAIGKRVAGSGGLVLRDAAPSEASSSLGRGYVPNYVDEARQRLALARARAGSTSPRKAPPRRCAMWSPTRGARMTGCAGTANDE